MCLCVFGKLILTEVILHSVSRRYFGQRTRRFGGKTRKFSKVFKGRAQQRQNEMKGVDRGGGKGKGI